MKIIEDMHESDYHSSPGLSSTILKAYGTSAEKGKATEDGVIAIGEKTAAFGSAFHCSALEPERFSREYVGKPEGMSFTTKEGKAWRDAQSGKIVTADDLAGFRGMSAALYADERMGPFMRAKGRNELSLFAEIDGIPVRARLDRLIDGGPIVDLKSTVCAEPFAFTRQMIKLRYAVQAWFYSEVLKVCGLPFNGFVFGAVEKTAPYSVLCCELDDEAFNKGREEGERLFELYRKCHREKKWPGYISQSIPYQIKFPRWAIEMQNPAEQIIYDLEPT